MRAKAAPQSRGRALVSQQVGWEESAALNLCSVRGCLFGHKSRRLMQPCAFNFGFAKPAVRSQSASNKLH
jgi:hypothetical protein